MTSKQSIELSLYICIILSCISFAWCISLQIENKNQAKKIEFHQELFEAAVNDINRLNNNDALIEENFNMLFANDKNLDERVNILYKYLGSD